MSKASSFFKQVGSRAPQPTAIGMATPFTALQEPTDLRRYIVSAHHDSQPDCIPRLFIDAMEVREIVFVKEQGVPPTHEFDPDDSRAYHWIGYASVHKILEEELRNEAGDVIRPRKSETRKTPISTVRLVPFPHPPHPEPGVSYYDGQPREINGVPIPDSEHTETPMIRGTPPYIIDRVTTFHDGQEPYVKLGRLAVLREYRKHGMAHILLNRVFQWLRDNPTRFNPSVKRDGLAKMLATDLEIPRWRGLICIHAQEQAVPFWEKMEFVIDEKMGTWYEEGIRHVGMFRRLELEETRILI